MVAGVLGGKVCYLALNLRSWRHSLRVGWCIQGALTGATVVGIAGLTLLRLPSARRWTRPPRAVHRYRGGAARLFLYRLLRRPPDGVAVGCVVLRPSNGKAQPTVSHHLKVLREAGIVGSERQGLWAYFYVIPDALKEISTWLI